MKENNQNFNPEDWYNRLYQEIYKLDGEKQAKKEVEIAKAQQHASPNYPVEEYIEMITM